MHTLVLLVLIVKLCFILTVKSDESPIIRTEINKPNQKIKPVENKQLHMQVYGVNFTSLNEEKPTCGGHCEVYQNILDLRCQVNTEHNFYLDVTTLDIITKEHSGQWKCTFNVNQALGESNIFDVTVKADKLTTPPSNTIITSTDQPSNTPTPETKTTSLNSLNWTYIAAGVGTVVILVVIGQTICIIQLKKKAKAARRDLVWNRNDEDVEAKGLARYSKMPGQKIKEEIELEDRASRIYEALENVRPDAPLPPPIESLPRKKSPKVASVPVEPKEIPTPKGLNSLLRRKKKKKKELIDAESDSKRSTLERIKERPPLPLPGEEVYESLDEETGRPPSPKRDAKKKLVKKKEIKTKSAPNQTIKTQEKPIAHTEDLKDFAQPAPGRPKPPVSIPGMTVPNHMGVPIQLKEALEQRMRMNTLAKTAEPLPPPKPQPTPKLIQQADSPIQPRKPWQKEPSTLTRDPYTSQKRPVEPQIPKASPFLPKVMPNDSTTQSAPYLREKPWQNEPNQTGPYIPKEAAMLPREKPWQELSQTAPYVPSQKPWPSEAITPKTAPYVTKEKTWPKPPPPLGEMPKEIGVSMTMLAGFNPGLPPPDAPPAKIRTPWGDTMPPKPRPAPPRKPKQLHPLPVPPCEPEPYNGNEDFNSYSNSEESDAEDWNYEPLPKYNIYSL